MRNFMPTPNKGLLLELSKHYNIQLIDEFRTSCLSSYNHEYVTNMKIEFLNDKTDPKPLRKLHSVLTYKRSVTGSLIRDAHINRDRNAVLNMEYLYRELINGNERPIRFRRGVTLDGEPVEDEPVEEL